jgi:F0F1-type ATP synthase assembly protein I
MEGTGAGLGIFLQYLGQALPPFLIILGMIAVVIAIGIAIAMVIKKAVTYVHVR